MFQTLHAIATSGQEVIKSACVERLRMHRNWVDEWPTSHATSRGHVSHVGQRKLRLRRRGSIACGVTFLFRRRPSCSAIAMCFPGHLLVVLLLSSVMSTLYDLRAFLASDVFTLSSCPISCNFVICAIKRQGRSCKLPSNVHFL